MRTQFLLNAVSFIVGATLLLSAGQAWASAGRYRRARYLIVWAAVAALMVWLGMRLLQVNWSDPIMRGGSLGRAVVTLSAVLSAAALATGAAWVKSKKLEQAPFRRRAHALSVVHLAVMLLGGPIAYVLAALVWVSQIH